MHSGGRTRAHARTRKRGTGACASRRGPLGFICWLSSPRLQKCRLASPPISFAIPLSRPCLLPTCPRRPEHCCARGGCGVQGAGAERECGGLDDKERKTKTIDRQREGGGRGEGGEGSGERRGPKAKARKSKTKQGRRGMAGQRDIVAKGKQARQARKKETPRKGGGKSAQISVLLNQIS